MSLLLYFDMVDCQQRNDYAHERRRALKYRTRAIINRGYYFFSLFCDVGFSLTFGGIPLKLRGY